MALNVGYVARETGQNLGRNPTLTLASVLTVALSLTFVGVGLLMRQGVDDLTDQFKGDVELIIFLDPAITAEQRDAIESSLEENPEVRDFDYFDSKESFEEAQVLFEDQPTMLRLLREQDVPTSFRVEPTNPDVQAVIALRATYQDEPGVRQVESATEVIRAIQELSQKLNRGVLWASLINAAVAILLIYNTIRTAMYARRREIEVMKLVGATNWFIRVPFIIEGMVQALLGGLVSVLMLLGVNAGLFRSLADTQYFELFEAFEFSTGTVISAATIPLFFGLLIGIIGSGFAVGRFLDV